MNYLKHFLFSLLFIMTVGNSHGQEKNLYQVDKILRLNIDSSINPATLNYLKGAFQSVDDKEHQLILIKMNTPGGLVSTTKEILTLFGESDTPVVVWVTPEGASATSAGAIIASGAHVLLMSDGTNIGAATPVQMGEDIGKDLRKKAVNDLVALVGSLSETRGRNAKLFGEMISEAKSFKAKEAKEKKLIDGIANSNREFKEFLQGKSIVIKSVTKKLNLSDTEITDIKMDLGQRLLDILANPSFAYILFLLGAALIYLELQAPGGFVAGSIGAVALVLAGIGFQILPLNFGALGLIVLSFILFVMEAYITSYGILSIAGMAALIAGSLFLFRTDNAYIELSTGLIVSAVAAIGIFLLFIVMVIARTHKNIGKKHFNEMIGKKGQIIEEIPSDNDGVWFYHIKVSGEIWKAESSSQHKNGDWCEVVSQNDDNMTLKI